MSETVIAECFFCQKVEPLYPALDRMICGDCKAWMDNETEPNPVGFADPDPDMERRKYLVYKQEEATQQARGHLKKASEAAQKAQEVLKSMKGGKHNE